MIVILGLDGLEYEYVKDFNCKNLMQVSFGKTDISEFSEPKTIVLWSSFLSGKNLEKRVLALGKKFWKFKLKVGETFFKKFEKWKAIDVPGLSYKYKKHQSERKLLKDFFDGRVKIEEYDKLAFKNYRENKKELFEELGKEHEILMCYFALADTIGHLSFGLKTKMKIIYKELDKTAKKVKNECEKLLIISDHGMKAIGRFGDHTKEGFWSFSEKINLNKPKITEFYNLIIKWYY